MLVVSLDIDKRRIALTLAPEPDHTDTQAYLRETTKQGDGFRLTLGERFKQSPRSRP